MTVERAGKNDIPVLTELRLAFLSEDLGGLSEENVNRLRQALPAYFERQLNQSLFCYLIRENDRVVSCAFLLMTEKPPSPMFPTGKTGTVLNVYTLPAYRRRGYARRIMAQLLADAAKEDLSVVELKATEDGYPLYQSLGFREDASKYRAMKWRSPSCG